MLKIQKSDSERCGGILSALSDNSAEYLWDQISRHKCHKQQLDSPPGRTVLHKDPHLDDYLGELLFRAAMPSDSRPIDFLEMAIYAENDSNARMFWEESAVFGMGSGLPCAGYAKLLFDEHIHTGGRTADSCAHLVAEQCYTKLPASLLCILSEIGRIDSQGGAHPLHLNNLLKTVHQVRFISHSTENRSDLLPDIWKRGIVNALITAVLFCLNENIKIRDSDQVKEALEKQLKFLETDPPFEISQHHNEALHRLRSTAYNLQGIMKGNDDFLVLPFLAVAASKAWGDEVAAFLMTPFIEAEILGQINFKLVKSLAEDSYKDRNEAHTSSCSVEVLVVDDCNLRSRKLWIISCRHTNDVVQPHKALLNFLNTRNGGIGLVFLDNIDANGKTKVLFKGQGVPDDYWKDIVHKIQSEEPKFWYQPSETASFLLNGNATHRYIPLSSLTLNNLKSFCE